MSHHVSSDTHASPTPCSLVAGSQATKITNPQPPNRLGHRHPSHALLVSFLLTCLLANIPVSFAEAYTGSYPQSQPPIDKPTEKPASAGNWQEERNQQYRSYIAAHQIEYDWFANFGNSFSGVPFILLRVFPELAPEIWGKPEEQFAAFGFIPEIDRPDRPLPLGLGWEAADHKTPRQYDPKKPSLHVVSLTCGACHIGRVRLEDWSYQIIVGAPNTQFDPRKWRRAFELFVDKTLKDDASINATAEQVVNLIATKPPGYFYNNFQGFGAELEASQRAIFSKKETVSAILNGLAQKIRLGRLAIIKQKTTSYAKNGPPLDGGSPGQSDGSGDLLPKLLHYEYFKGATPAEIQEKSLSFLLTDFPALPKHLATVTDIISVWNQADVPLAQIDGSVKSPFFRNIAAIVAVAVDPKDVNYVNADFSERFTRKLPAPAYPFPVDEARAAKGAVIFSENCGACHKPGNPTLYQSMGTDFNRARVLNEDGFALFGRNFRAAVPKGYTVTDAEGKIIEPAALPVDDILIARTTSDKQGYVTDSLAGVWARAPYLHNGSVPTLRHLLASGNPESQRPVTFVRGSISYDQKNVGFVWDASKLEEYRKHDSMATLFDAALDGQSNKGHQTNIVVDGKLRKVDWSGEENRESLENLLEYLKTL